MITYPKVTIVMPVRNEAVYIERSLDSVLKQDYPLERLEIIVADGISDDGTREIVSGFQCQHPTLYLIDNPGRIVPTALNLALVRARSEIIIRVDGHCEIAPDYVRQCVEHIQMDGVDGVGGPIETVGETWVAQAIALATSSPFGVGGSAFRTIRHKTMLADSVPFPAYTRAIVERAGLYDEELVRNQDDEYNYRLRKMGAKILLAADVRSRYYSRSSLLSLWRQYFQYGYWKVRVLQKHPRQMRPRQLVPFAFVASLLSAGLLGVFYTKGWLLLALITLVYVLANISSSLWVSNQRGWRYVALLPFVFVILHLSYGFGFIVGLMRFSNRWGDKQGKVPTWSDIEKRGDSDKEDG